ncbi:Pol protein [Pyrenophora tritici-repentis]|nr:Pol protein [Pyrenophora tritici-repentis]
MYCRTPEGFTGEFSELLELQRALYGLKEAPLLWYQELLSTLKKFGLKPVLGVLCLFTSDHLIVFFYVDDIVVLVHPLNMNAYQVFKQQLLSTYDIRELGELKWFLGIRVIREELTRSIYLIQDSFIDKIATKFDLKLNGRYPDVPLKENHLLPLAEEPSAARTHRYQQLVGSLAYISTSTRPDVARAHSILARHLQNPGQKHIYAAQHVWRYLIGTKNLAIRASADIQHGITSISTPEVAQQELEPLFYGALDAAFADEPETRRSSQGYLFKLYGLPIDWKATVQRSVTKSTTEAELLSLSLAGSEIEWWQRFFQAI